jgi:SagB-type dehydrogenase family enzyme
VSLRYLLSFKHAVTVTEQDGDLVIFDQIGAGARLRASPAAHRLVEGLTQGGKTAEALLAAATDSPEERGQISGMLESMYGRGLLASLLVAGDRPLATLEPLSPSFRSAEPAPEGAFRLSRFASLRREGDEMTLESLLAPARLVLHDARLAAIVGMLAQPCRTEDLAGAIPGFESALARAFVVLLAAAGAVLPCDAAGRTDEDRRPSLRLWEFHDLHYHSRSRVGRNAQAAGATLRFHSDLAPLPAIKAPMSPRRIALYKPDLAALAETDRPFSRVAESRASRRNPAAQPLHVDGLGEFLYRAARIKAVLPANPQAERYFETALRPAPSGGGTHSLELYLSVHRMDGLAPGFYRYDPAAHMLDHLSEPTAASRRLLADAVAGAGLTEPPDALITLATRFGRVAWKYEAIAYALVLKEVGALMQQMYLVATAQGLSPCALGAGNPDVFAQASGLDYFEECSVGEFMLSGA